MLRIVDQRLERRNLRSLDILSEETRQCCAVEVDCRRHLICRLRLLVIDTRIVMQRELVDPFLAIFAI